jgi:hypothetical protein
MSTVENRRSHGAPLHADGNQAGVAVSISVRGNALQLHVKEPAKVTALRLAVRSSVGIEQLAFGILACQQGIVRSRWAVSKFLGKSQSEDILEGRGHKPG